MISFSSFSDELEKIAGGGGFSGRSALELAGLGTLAAPSVSGLRGKEWSEHNKHKAEIAGLGMLAAPYAKDGIQAGVGKAKAFAKARSFKNAVKSAIKGPKNLLLKAASEKKAGYDVWNPETGAVTGSHGGTKATNMGLALNKKPTPAPTAVKANGMDMLKKLKSMKPGQTLTKAML